MTSLNSNSRAIQQSLGLSSDVIYSTGYELLEKLKVHGSILDFGSGQGRFLSMLFNLGFEKMSGADLMEAPSQLPSLCRWVQTDLNNQLPLADESFDVIVAIEVIEHLENPRAMIRELKRLLRPGGYIILSTPNNESVRAIFSLMMKGHFVSFLEKNYPAHITALTSLDIKRIFIENNFSEIKFIYINKGLIPGLRGVTWQNLSLGVLKGKRFSDNIFAIARK